MIPFNLTLFFLLFFCFKTCQNVLTCFFYNFNLSWILILIACNTFQSLKNIDHVYPPNIFQNKNLKKLFQINIYTYDMITVINSTQKGHAVIKRTKSVLTTHFVDNECNSSNTTRRTQRDTTNLVTTPTSQ